MKFVFSLTEEPATNRVLIPVQRGDYTETHTKREATSSPPGRRSQPLFHFRSGFSIKVQKSTVLSIRKNFLWKNKWFFHFCNVSLTLDTYTIHLHKTLAIDTYNSHLKQTLTLDTYIMHYKHQVTF